MSFEHTFSENAEFYSFFTYSDLETVREWDGISFSRTAHLVHAPTTLGALSTFVGNPPVLAPAANNPHLASNGGFGQGYYGGGVRTGWPRSTEDILTTNTTSGAQVGLRGELEGMGFNDTALSYDVSLAWSDSSIEQNYATLIRDRTEMALYGLGGPNCTPNGTPNLHFEAIPSFGGLSALFDTVFPGYVLNTRESTSYALTSTNHGQDGCQFFNPYLTALTNPELANSQELTDWMTGRINRADKRNQLLVFDAVVSGEMFEMTGGTAQFAAGIQRRERMLLALLLRSTSRASVLSKDMSLDCLELLISLRTESQTT